MRERRTNYNGVERITLYTGECVVSKAYLDELEWQRDVLYKELLNMSSVDAKDWHDDFEVWARSRARFVCDKIKGNQNEKTTMSMW